MVAAAGTASAQSTWTNPLGGDWTDAANWDTATAPLGAGESAIFPVLGSPYDVLCNTSPAIDAVAINDPNARLLVGANRTLRVVTNTGINNDGVIVVNDSASVFDSFLTFDPGLGMVPLGGSGSIELNGAGGPNDARLVVDAGTTLMLTQPVSGAGRIDAVGLVGANAPITGNIPTFDLRITGNLQLGPGGSLEGTNGGFVEVSAAVTGGQFLGGVEIGASTASLDGVSMSGDNGIRNNHAPTVGAGGITNNGTFTINTAGSVFDTFLDSAAPCTLDGTGSFDLNGAGGVNDARIRATAGNPITIGSGVTITGNGSIEANDAPIELRGTVLADRLDQDLQVEGTIDAVSTGSFGSAGGIVLMNAADVSNVTINGATDTVNVSSITDSTNNDVLSIRGNSRLAISGTLANNGTLVINKNASVFNTFADVDTDVTINGVGSIVLNGIGEFNDAQLEVDPAATLTIEAGQSVEGTGILEGDGLAIIKGSVLANNAVADLRLQSNLDLTGATLQGSLNDVDINDADMTGGTSLGGVVFTGTSDARGFTNSADMGVRNNSTVNLDGDFTNNGVFTVNTDASVFDSRLSAAAPVTINGTGTIFLNGAGTPADAQLGADEAMGGSLTLPVTQTVIGNGRIDGPTTVQGTLAPGVDNSTAGTFGLIGDVTLGATASVQLDFFDLATFDSFSLNSDLVLDGEIELRLQNGYEPNLGDRFDIINASSVTGVFPTINTPVIGTRLFRVIESGSDVDALWTCFADVNLDGALTPTDFTAWINAFNNNDTEVADQNFDGMVSPTDFTAWIANFNSGC